MTYCHITVITLRSVQSLYSSNLKYMKKLCHYIHLFVSLPFVLSEIFFLLHANEYMSTLLKTQHSCLFQLEPVCHKIRITRRILQLNIAISIIPISVSFTLLHLPMKYDYLNCSIQCCLWPFCCALCDTMETTPATTNQYLLKAAHLTVTTSSSEIKNDIWSKNRWYSITNIADVSSSGS